MLCAVVSRCFSTRTGPSEIEFLVKMFLRILDPFLPQQHISEMTFSSRTILSLSQHGRLGLLFKLARAYLCSMHANV